MIEGRLLRITRRLLHLWARADALWRHGNRRAALTLVRCAVTKRHRVLTVRLHGVPVAIRTGTPDLEVALSCLGGEFAAAIAAVGPARHGLILDAGGYIGTAAIAFARAFPEATVVTVEPAADNLEILQRNVAPFPTIQVVPKALVADGTAPATLRARPTGPVGYSIALAPQDRGAPAGEPVPTITPQALLQQQGRSGFDLVKLDIEGAEHALLTPGAVWLAATRVLCVELHDRIRPGCTRRYMAATADRTDLPTTGEKWISVARAAPTDAGASTSG